jgi:hypothetical protein
MDVSSELAFLDGLAADTAPSERQQASERQVDNAFDSSETPASVKSGNAARMDATAELAFLDELAGVSGGADAKHDGAGACPLECKFLCTDASSCCICAALFSLHYRCSLVVLGQWYLGSAMSAVTVL